MLKTIILEKLARVESEFIDKNKDTNILGYPDYYFLSQILKLTDYNSGRDLESFQNFLKENEVKSVVRPSKKKKNDLLTKKKKTNFHKEEEDHLHQEEEDHLHFSKKKK